MSWNHTKVTETTGCLKILVDSFYFEKENHNFTIYLSKRSKPHICCNFTLLGVQFSILCRYHSVIMDWLV